MRLISSISFLSGLYLTQNQSLDFDICRLALAASFNIWVSKFPERFLRERQMRQEPLSYAS